MSDNRDSRPSIRTSRGGGSVRGNRGGRASASERPERASARELAEITTLDARCVAEAPESGSLDSKAEDFASLPLSRATQSALERARFTKLTSIQRVAIPHALSGRDVLGAAKTGSGKTLAFIVPLLERLYRARWSAGAGLGGLVISPTRELAMQTFEVLRVVGGSHNSLSAGLLTGGRDFAEEAAAVGELAIVIATPGRLLQHLEQTPEFDASSLLVLVLDEADRLLDLGFSEALNAVLAYLPPPPQRQTLLFSATQSRSVRDLARLSLSTPEFVSVHEDAASATPSRLTQHYVVARASDKLNLLWSFLKTHAESKIIVFISACKEARFIFEAFRRLRPGLPLQVLHGKMKQSRRMLVYYDFIKKPSAALFATDIAARGLDFPSVDWVVQLDAPEDAACYIHRVGRTARFKARGHSLLVLSPQEAKGLVPVLTEARIPIARTHIAPSAAISITGKLAAEVAADNDLRQLAQRAFVSYIRSIALQPNKSIFSLSDISAREFASSYGLAAPPDAKLVRLMQRDALAAPELGDAEDVLIDLSTEESARVRAESKKKKNENKSLARLKEKITLEKAARRAKRSGGAAETGTQGNSDGDADGESSGDDGEDEIITRRSSAATANISDGLVDENDGDLSVPEESLARLGERERARIFAIARDSKLIGAGGAAVDPEGLTPFMRVALEKGGGKQAPALPANLEAAASAFSRRVAERLARSDDADRAREKGRVKEKHRTERQQSGEKVEQGGGVTLGGFDDDGGSGSGNDSGEDGQEDAVSEPLREAPISSGKRARAAESADAAPSKRQNLQDMEALALRALGARKV